MTHYSFHGAMGMAMLAFSVREGTTAFDVASGRITSTRFGAYIDEIARGDVHLSTLREREARCAASDDLREGRLAMAEKRAPRFTGR